MCIKINLKRRACPALAGGNYLYYASLKLTAMPLTPPWREPEALYFSTLKNIFKNNAFF
jgi:hypothetical protein